MRRPGPQEGWRSPSDWVRSQSGQWVKAPVQRTRGLNRNSNHTLKRIFKGAATTVIGRRDDDPLYRHYERLLEGGTKPNLAKLTIARQIAAVSLALWRSGERYDPERLEGAEAKTSLGDRRNNRPVTVEGKVRRGSGEGKKAGFRRIEGGRGRRGRKG